MNLETAIIPATARERYASNAYQESHGDFLMMISKRRGS